MSGRELAKRLVVAALGIPVALLVVFAGGWLLASALAIVAGLAAREVYVLGREREVEAFSWLGVPGAAALVLLAGLTRAYEAFAFPALTLVLLVFFTSAVAGIWLRWPGGRPLFALSLTLGGMIYTGGLLSFALFLRHLPGTSGAWPADLRFQGPLLLAFVLAVTWMGDTAAYFFGNWMGTRRLIPAVSPGKTVAGGVAGLLTSGLVGVAAGWLALVLHPHPGTSALLGGVIGLLLGVGAQVGDLVESVLKRDAGVKDSGTLLPGHGGVLDRFDALFFTLPLAYLLVHLAGALR